MRSLKLISIAAALSRYSYGHPTAQQHGIQSRQSTDYEAYLFAYFTGNTLEGETISFATSQGNDALHWTELNDGKPYITSAYGTGGLRDPFIIRAHDSSKVYLIATDLSIGSGTSWGDAVVNGSRYIEVWETDDLVNWSDQRHVLVSPPTAGNTWAPEAFWDATIDQYVVFWASQLYNESDTNHTGASYARMLYATTTDFVTFTEPQIWQDGGSAEAARIDSTVYQDEGSDIYYRFTKSEGGAGGCRDIIQESSTNLTGNLAEWTTIATCIGQNAGLGNVEGPDVFRSNPGDVNGDQYYLFVDEYTSGGYVPLVTADIADPDWQVAKNYTLPLSPRHGTVLPITAAELKAINAIGAPESSLGSGLYADPTIVAYCGKYYIYPTTDGVPNWGGNVLYVWSSDNLVDWTRTSEPVLTLNGTDGNVPWAVGNAWAPTVIERDGLYYIYFSGQNPTYDQKTIGAAVASSPVGPFKAQPTAMITNTENITTSQAIDSAAFQDPMTGKYYILWGNGDLPDGGPRIAELGDDMVSIKLETLAKIEGLTNFREGIWINYREPFYHMTYSIDDTRSVDYRVGYATSDSINGPWTYNGIILEKQPSQGILATGHSSIVNVPDTDDWYIAYHRFNIPNGNGTEREVMVDPLYFDDETGLIEKVNPSWDGVQIPQTYASTCTAGGGYGDDKSGNGVHGKGWGKGKGPGKGKKPGKGPGHTGGKPE